MYTYKYVATTNFLLNCVNHKRSPWFFCLTRCSQKKHQNNNNNNEKNNDNKKKINNSNNTKKIIIYKSLLLQWSLCLKAMGPSRMSFIHTQSTSSWENVMYSCMSLAYSIRYVIYWFPLCRYNFKLVVHRFSYFLLMSLRRSRTCFANRNKIFLNSSYRIKYFKVHVGVIPALTIIQKGKRFYVIHCINVNVRTYMLFLTWWCWFSHMYWHFTHHLPMKWQPIRREITDKKWKKFWQTW